jgi:hypothetical protein
MEVVSREMTIRTGGIVVRQFVPTRIEREILTHVFALVGGRRNQMDASCNQDVASESSLREGTQRIGTFEERRRAS